MRWALAVLLLAASAGAAAGAVPAPQPPPPPAPGLRRLPRPRAVWRRRRGREFGLGWSSGRKAGPAARPEQALTPADREAIEAAIAKRDRRRARNLCLVVCGGLRAVRPTHPP